MQALLKFSQGVDWISIRLGKLSMWLILITTVISAANAIVRKAFDISSNALLEVQWYLFAGVFLLGAGYCLLQNAHVRIDFVASRLSARARNWVDVFGILLVLFPFCWIVMDLGWPLFMRAWESGEMSQNAGGLVRWPAYLMIPVGFAMLMLQGASELIKRIAFLTGQGPDPLAHGDDDEEARLAAELAAQLEAQSRQPGTPGKA
ncbi:MAG: TRAP transporter small permease subunit [Burkholderiaceae bacterium]